MQMTSRQVSPQKLVQTYQYVHITFIDLFFAWRYGKSVPVFAFVAHSLMACRNYILNSNSLPLYEANFPSLQLVANIDWNKNFLSHSVHILKNSSPISKTIFITRFHTSF